MDAVGALSLAQLMVLLDATVINIALPRAQRRPALLVGESSVDRSPPTPFPSVPALARRTVASAISGDGARRSTSASRALPWPRRSGASAHSFAMLVTARAIQGAFGALLAPAALAALSVTFREPQRASQGLCHLRRDRRIRRRHRTTPRWRPHPVGLVAVVSLRQPLLRRARHGRSHHFRHGWT